MRVEVKPELLRWARERAGLGLGTLATRFPHLEAWERGDDHPTFKQLESFAKATHAPIGYLFLQTPPVEHVPIPDFRTIGNTHLQRPSPDLLDTIRIGIAALSDLRGKYLLGESRGYVETTRPTSKTLAALPRRNFAKPT
jgi:transcriptional regulator with XRE-family HTH domain